MEAGVGFVGYHLPRDAVFVRLLDGVEGEETMNRRNFIRGLLATGASFTILPPALHGPRIWKAVKPDYVGCFLTRAQIIAVGPEMFRASLDHECAYTQLLSETKRQALEDAFSKFKDLPIV